MEPLLLALGVLLLWQLAALRGAARRRREGRAQALDAVRDLLDGARLAVEPDGFPRLAGAYGGALVELRLLPDALALRKLPALWLLATLRAPQPIPGTWHLLLRPRGEAFSAHDRLPRQAPLPEGLPADASLRADAPGDPPAALAEAWRLAGSPRLKEVVLSPHGLRLTTLLAEAERGRYLLFRDSEFGEARVSRDDARRLLDGLLALQARLAEEA